MIRRLVVFLWLIPLALNAQMDPAAKAAQIAGNFMGSSQQLLKNKHLQQSVVPFGNPDKASLFVVNYEPSGFVIVSTNSSTNPVLGYSLTSSFPLDPAHPLRNWLLPLYQSIYNHPSPIKNGQKMQYATDQIVLPLISAQWGQGHPWNSFCPADAEGNRALVGCVAVAMSQIMSKWDWPPHGYGEVTYSPLQHPEYGEISANFDTTRYQWNLAHDTYPSQASALILFHTGVSTFMNYDPALSSTSVDRYAVPAFTNHFFYNRGMVFREMEGISSADWVKMLHQELDNSRPVLYAGTSPNGKSSHAFNIDGYRNDTYFHFNWGWNGAGDGWYTLSGMAGGGADFSTQQGAIFGIQPAGIPLHDRPSALQILAGDGFNQLFWEQPVIADFSHYSIYRNDTLVGETANTRFRDEGIQNGRTYTYKVSAWYQGDTPGESSYTPTVNAIPWNRILPGYIQNFESGAEGWQLLDSTCGFRLGMADSLLIGGNAGNIAAIRSEGHQAGEQVADYLTSPAIYPLHSSRLAISFDYVYKQNPGIDQLQVMWRSFSNGRWQVIAKLDSTGGYSDWRNLHFYLPESIGTDPVQVAFYYNDSFQQGFGAAIDNFMVYEVLKPAIPNLSIDNTDFCLEQPVVFEDRSEGYIHTWEWDFGEGAEPRYANTSGPHQVSYSSSGKKMVKLSLNHLDHLQIPDALSIRDKPIALFEYQRKFQEVIFVNKSAHAEQFLWLFGDGTSSTEPNPVHKYFTKDLFEVKQIAYNGPCAADTLTITIDMRSGTGIDEIEPENNLSIYPNPTTGRLVLQWESLSQSPVTIRILSANGQTFFFRDFPRQKELTLDLSDFPHGFYILQITSGKVMRNEQIFKINN
jgi:hypothetical protein